MRVFSLRRLAPSAAVMGFVIASASVAAAQAAPAASVPPPAPPPGAAPAAPTAAAAPLTAPPPAPPGAAPAPAAYPAYPPPGAYPAPAAYPPPPPGYAYAYPVAPRPPESVPYDGGPVPAGYHVEERPRRGAVIAGAIIIGSSYAIGLTVASTDNFPNSTGWLVVPVLGPWITLGARHKTNLDCGDFGCTGNTDDNSTRTFLILDGLTQATGAFLLIYGATSAKKVIARDFVGRLNFTPSEIGRGGVGGFLTGSF